MTLVTNIEILRKDAGECSEPPEGVLYASGTVVHAASCKYQRADQGSSPPLVGGISSRGAA
jgi:hypothetical protein